MDELIYKSEALHAVLHNEGQAEVAAIENIKQVELMDYPLAQLILFAKACKAEGIQPGHLREVCMDIEWGMTVVRNELDRAIRECIPITMPDGSVKIEGRIYLPTVNLEQFDVKIDDWRKAYEAKKKDREDED